MSDYGLVVKNNSQEIQIDSKYRNFSLDQSGSKTLTNAGSFSITASPLLPLILVQPNTNYFVMVRAYFKTSSNYTSVDLVTEKDSTTTINWKCYRENRTFSGDNYGMLVYNSSGDLCFDSGKNYFKIYSVTSSINISPISGYTDITHTGISNPYYILSPCSFWTGPGGYSPPFCYRRFYFAGIKKLTSTSVRVGWFYYTQTYYSSNPEDCNTSSGGNNPTFKLIVCDVT